MGLLQKYGNVGALISTGGFTPILESGDTILIYLKYLKEFHCLIPSGPEKRNNYSPVAKSAKEI